MKQKTSKAIIKDRVIILFLPILISLLAFYVINNACVKHSFIISEVDGIDNIKTMLGIWGTLLGFLITAVSILLALDDGKFLSMLKNTGHYKTILLSYIICCLHLFVAVVISVICIFVKMWSMTIFAVMCAIAIDTMVLVAVCLFFLFVLVVRVND